MATPSASDLNDQYEDRRIPLELLEEPAVPERETMEETDLADLALNISEVGLIKPLIVKPLGDRFEVVAGHRRLLACRLVNYSPVPCRVKRDGDVDPLAILIAENAHVEKVNAIEEARFYRRVLEEHCQNDVDLLCVKLKRRREYVEDRLILLMGHETVIEALHQKRISIAVARELNKVKDPNALLILLDTAKNQGATARQVEAWRREYDNLPPIQLASADPADQADNPTMIPYTHSMECFFCRSTEFPHMMELIYLHKYCKQALDGMLNRGTAAAPPQQN